MSKNNNRSPDFFIYGLMGPLTAMGYEFIFILEKLNAFCANKLVWHVHVLVSSAPTLLRLHLAVIFCCVIQRCTLTWPTQMFKTTRAWATTTKYSVFISNIECTYFVIYFPLIFEVRNRCWFFNEDVVRYVWLLVTIVSPNDLNVI